MEKGRDALDALGGRQSLPHEPKPSTKLNTTCRVEQKKWS